ncbi:MAG: hypothetical protein RLZZ519_2347 [Bacteroidota bacterium]|jgi:hypothetical protein
MENDNKLKQPKTQETAPKTDVWTSGFDSKTTPKASPPPMQLSSDPIKGPQEPEEGEYDPETIVFDIGGFADPQNPGGDNGKGIMVTIPPDLDGPTALVQVVMEMLRLTESEAKIAIVKENLQWIDYKVNGQGLDRMGNAVHLLRFKPTYSERVAHEPESQKPQDAAPKEKYTAFKLYLAEHDCDNIRDPYVQYDNWAKTPPNMFFVEDVKEPGRGMFGTDFGPARIEYEQMRESVVKYVVWERLRAKRESLAKGIKDENGDVKANVAAMADSFPALIDAETMRKYIPAKYYSDWVSLHSRMIEAMCALDEGDPSMLQQGGLGARVFELAKWFTEHKKDRKVAENFHSREQLRNKFSDKDVQQLLGLVSMTDFNVDRGRELVQLYYKLTFAIMEVAGHLIASFDAKHPKGDNDEPSLAGLQMENQGKAGAAMLGLISNHPNAKKISATFYPEKETKDFRQGGEKDGGNDWSNGMPLELFLWHDEKEGEWVLEDFSDLDSQKENRVKGGADAPVPAALFEQLNSKLRFPKGALFYRVPNEGSYRILRTTEPTTLGDWLRTVAIAGLVIGMAVGTMGASIPAQVIMIGSSVAMAGAEISDMVEEKEQGMLGTQRIVLHSALIASCIFSGATASLRMAGMASSSTARIVAGLQVGADSVCVAVFSKEAYEGLRDAANDPEGITFTRLLGFFLQMGMNGLMLYGVKGSAMEATGAKEMSAAEKLLEAEAKATKRGERMAAREEKIQKGKNTFNKELENLFGKERGRVVSATVKGAAAFGLGSVTVTISMKNFRRLCKIIGTLVKTGGDVSVDIVIKHLEKLGVRSRDLLAADHGAIQLAINDVKRVDMTAEEIAFADSYYLHVLDSELTNYELREFHRHGYTVDAETGSLVKPNGRTVNFKHEFLPHDLRSKSFDFQRYIDFEADGDLMALVKGRQQLRERIAEVRRDIKARQASGEQIPQAEMDAFYKEASEVGVMSENIAERSLQKYIAGEGYIKLYPPDGAPSSKSGDFDRIYMKKVGGRYQIFEVKGGSSPIKDRIINNVEGIAMGTIAEQGTLPYFKQILHEMGKKEATAGLAEDLLIALDKGKVDYMYYKQGFDDFGKLKQPEVGQFDIRKPELEGEVK